MRDYSNLLHIDFIKSILEKSINEKGILDIGNNLNDYFNFEIAEKYANSLKKEGTDRVQKSSKDPIMGRLVEELIIYLLYEYFDYNKLQYGILNSNNDKKIIDTFKIIHEKMEHEKVFDIDIIIFNREKKESNKYYLLSCKGSVRERIGQYIANLFGTWGDYFIYALITCKIFLYKLSFL